MDSKRQRRGPADAMLSQPANLGIAVAVAICASWNGGATLGGLALLIAVAAIRLLAPEEQPDSKARARANERLNGGASSETAKLCGTFVPSTGLMDFGEPEFHCQENDFCKSKLYLCYKPMGGTNAHGAHFKGKKRLWEWRWQVEVKAKAQRPLVFGIQLAEYVPVSGWAQRIQQVTLAMMRKVAGEDLYHSNGDDPRTTDGEAEKPVFVMPFWAFDQIIISDVGKEPDIRDIEGLGVRRTDNRMDFIRKMSSLQMEPGKVYTFNFWCISRFVDVVNWHMLGVVPGGVDFNTFCGRPPVHIVAYGLDDSGDEQDKRHLESRKEYYVNLAIWSSKLPPQERHLRAMLRDGDIEKVLPEPKPGQGWCCWR